MKKTHLKCNKCDKKRKIILCIISILTIMIIGTFLWMNKSYKYESVAAMALKSDNVTIENSDDFVVFTPKNVTPTKGFILYPGAKVEPEAYSPLCSKIAEAGYKVVIVKMPLNFAIFSPDKANEVIASYSDIDNWAIGGHSLGGVMASKYASENEKVSGVVLYASYPEGDELKSSNKKVVSIWGSDDGVVNLDKVKGENFPENTIFVEIKGGNHAQFGDYGAQSGDREAAISEEEQIDIAVKETIKVLEKL